jgi:signal transduction histidine kinase
MAVNAPALKLTLTTRIFLGYALVLVTFGAVSLFSVGELHRYQVELRLVSEGYLRLSQSVSAIENFQTNQAREADRLRSEPNPDTRRALVKLSSLFFPTLIAKNLAAAKGTADEILQFAPESEHPFVQEVIRKCDELGQRFHAYEQAVSDSFLTRDAPKGGDEPTENRFERLQQMESALSSALRLLHGSIQARIHDRVQQAQARERRTGVAIILLPVAAIIMGILATGFASRSLRPVRALIDGASRIRRGDFEASIGIRGDDEIAILAREFDAMARALKEREVQLQQKQGELLRAERLAAMGRVSAQVAHEVRNPLSSIGLNAEMLQEHLASATFATPEEGLEAKELLSAVMKEVDRVTEITDDYLRLARLPVPVRRPEDLREIVDSVLSFSREELERTGIQVVKSYGQAPVEVDADEGQLRQVLMNLVRNAREAMPTGGTLALSARRTDSGVELLVGDTGAGISPEARARLFEPFFTTKKGGTGLGLSLSRQIIEAHGGTIEIDAAPSVGTTFRLTLPSHSP